MRVLGLLVSVILVSGCELPAGGGGIGGGSGGGGGTMLAFTRGYVFIRKDDRNVYIADEKDLQTIARLTTSADARHPSLSKDGKRVVYVRQVGANTELATVATTGGSSATVLASSQTAKNFRNPVFSSDGRRIFLAYDSGASSVLGVVNLDGTGFKSVAGGSLSYASPSVFTRSSSGASDAGVVDDVLVGAGSTGSSLLQIEKVNEASGMPTNIASSLGNEAQSIVNRVVISPDGTKAAFDGRVASGSSRIFVINLTSKAVTKLTHYPADPDANDSFPCWVGNEKVGFSSDIGGNDQVYALPATVMNSSGGLALPSAIEPWYGP